MLTSHEHVPLRGLDHRTDLVHRVYLVRGGGASNLADWRTECGQRVRTRLSADQPTLPGRGCHECLPRYAHPMAPVWAACRRWDDNANAGAGLVRS